jgi:hypothetical protein
VSTRKLATRPKSGPFLGAFSLRVSANDGQIALEFMSGADPVPEMQGTMIASSALLLARMLLEHIPLGDIQGSPEIPNFDSSAPHDSGVSLRGLASSAPRPSQTTSRQGAAGLNGRCVTLDDTEGPDVRGEGHGEAPARKVRPRNRAINAVQ